MTPYRLVQRLAMSPRHAFKARSPIWQLYMDASAFRNRWHSRFMYWRYRAGIPRICLLIWMVSNVPALKEWAAHRLAYNTRADRRRYREDVKGARA